jgi:hypothetical protein
MTPRQAQTSPAIEENRKKPDQPDRIDAKHTHQTPKTE